MKKKGIKVAKKLINILMTLFILFSLITVGLSIYNLISFNVEVAKYVYLLIGCFLLPYEFLVTGKIGGLFQEQANCITCLLLAVGIIFFAIIILVNSSKMFNGKYSSKKRVFAGVTACSLTFILFLTLSCGAIILTLKYTQIENALNAIGPELIKTIKTNFGFNLITLKEIIICYFGAFVCLFAFLFFIVGMSKKSTKVKIVSGIHFYSSVYEEKKEDSKEKEQVKQQDVYQETEIPESNPKAQKLIYKIMQLEELRKAGKISTTDYTRLRQKAIKRYKN